MEKKNSFMQTKPVFSLLLSMSVPMMLSMLIQSLYNIVDSIYVSRLGTDALTAVSLAYPLQNAILSAAVGIGVGISSAISIHLGAGNREKADRAATLGIALTLIHCIFFIIAGLTISEPFLKLFTDNPKILNDASIYTEIVLCLSFGSLFQIAFEKIFQGIGEMKITMYLLIAGCVVNIILDPILIFGLLGFPALGVAGAAIATDLSQLVSCVLSLRFLMKSEDACRVELSAIRLHRKMAGRIIRVGLPTGIQNMVISFSNVLVQASVNSYGAAAMAGFAAYMKIDGFNILPVSSISMAATTFVGQNYGAGRLDRVKRSVWVTLAIGVLYTLCTGAALLAGQDAILHLFTADEAVVTYGKLAMRWFCPFYFLLSILHGLAGAVRGTGASIPPMVVLLVSLCLFRVVWIQFLLPFFSGIEGVFILYPVSWGLGALLMILYAWKGKWMEYHT